MKILGIIPARYGSSRLEGKPLLNIAGKTMIRRVYEQCIKCKELSEVVVATDDKRILDECEKYRINVVMTDKSHINGTERCAEVAANSYQQFDLVINIQGDEPFIHPESITELIQVFQNPAVEIGTLKKSISNESDVINPNIIKVVCAIDNRALYFSRSPVPYIRDRLDKDIFYFKHIGMYAFKREILEQIVKLKESPLEKSEKLEQLRWLENGYQIYLGNTEYESKSIDTEDDYRYILKNIHLYE